MSSDVAATIAQTLLEHQRRETDQHDDIWCSCEMSMKVGEGEVHDDDTYATHAAAAVIDALAAAVLASLKNFWSPR